LYQLGILYRQSRNDGRVAAAAAPVFFFGWRIRVKKRLKGNDGRFRRKDPSEEEPEPVMDEPAAVGAPRSNNCRAFARKRMAEEMPDIVSALIEKTKDGSVAHAKVLLELTGVMKEPVAPKGVKRRGKSVVGTLLEEIAEIQNRAK
jgi:hypothetical protein